METTGAASALVPAWLGSHAFDRDGAPVGRVADLFFDALTRAPGWVLLTLQPDRFVLAPARGLRHRAVGVQLACTLEHVRTAPTSAAPPDGIAQRHALTLARHYGVRCGIGPWHGLMEPALTGSVRVPAPTSGGVAS